MIVSENEFYMRQMFLNMILVAPPGLEPGLSALKGPRVNQLHHGAVWELLERRSFAGLEPSLRIERAD
jgi:hypothetical protein